LNKDQGEAEYRFARRYNQAAAIKKNIKGEVSVR
jgi:hypothetical protein